jgi:hypothetical protein
MHMTRPRLLAAFIAGVLILFSSPVRAQAWHYAAMQPADVTTPEANFIISGFGDYGMSFVGQYRWMADKRTQVWADVGLATPSGGTYFLLGAAGAWNFMKPTADKPIDVSATLGIYGAMIGGSNPSYVRIPVGIDIGHTWKLSNGQNLQGFAFPRLSIDICTNSNCSGTQGVLNFDVGASYDITKSMAGRAAFTFGGVGRLESQGGFGVSLAIKTK